MTSATLSTITLEDLKKQHKTLYSRAFEERTELVKDKAKMESFLAEVDPFLAELTEFSGEVESAEDFDWIEDSALKWQLALSTVLNVPHGPVTPTAPKNPKGIKFYNEQELQKWMEAAAREQYLTRWRNLLSQEGRSDLLRSTPEERLEDWHDAEILFATKVLEGSFHLTRQLDPESYPRLEKLWLDEVKQAKAFFLWQSRRDRETPPSRHREDYLAAARQLCSQLVREDLKATAAESKEIQEYLTRRYLTDGTLDPEKPGTTELLGRKAYRLWQITREPDPTKNWTTASEYCRSFYESFLSAALAEDPESRRKHTLSALQVLQTDEAQEHRHAIVSGFEVALAVYFLDAEVIQELWTEGALPQTL